MTLQKYVLTESKQVDVEVYPDRELESSQVGSAESKDSNTTSTRKHSSTAQKSAWDILGKSAQIPGPQPKIQAGLSQSCCDSPDDT
jgi:hypothetical protein